eukprot:gnl/TRDRNA2_/TRDRNA2_164854_c1_seq2.p2 gnl/TRDRNA2_/TRDRNA2_164854_c1~~gnl/TRDRNA2_/TRDRNA2_164854_c1_seq2.p2  ORF type:complete len:139 (+),score=32.95 gnl/TRDRNA2_/TRDRNA2_164854_c1_seq2:130-546(+)
MCGRTVYLPGFLTLLDSNDFMLRNWELPDESQDIIKMRETEVHKNIKRLLEKSFDHHDTSGDGVLNLEEAGQYTSMQGTKNASMLHAVNVGMRKDMKNMGLELESQKEMEAEHDVAAFKAMDLNADAKSTRRSSSMSG